jgi:hypothetical protein
MLKFIFRRLMVWAEMVSAGALLVGLFQDKPVVVGAVALVVAVWLAVMTEWMSSLMEGERK